MVAQTRPKTTTCGTCGDEFDVKPRGRIPNFCPNCRAIRNRSDGKQGGTVRSGICELCGTAFEAASHGPIPRFCSSSCKSRAKKGLPARPKSIPCERCGRTVQVKPVGRIPRYCLNGCSQEAGTVELRHEESSGSTLMKVAESLPVVTAPEPNGEVAGGVAAKPAAASRPAAATGPGADTAISVTEPDAPARTETEDDDDEDGGGAEPNSETSKKETEFDFEAGHVSTHLVDLAAAPPVTIRRTFRARLIDRPELRLALEILSYIFLASVSAVLLVLIFDTIGLALWAFFILPLVVLSFFSDHRGRRRY